MNRKVVPIPIESGSKEEEEPRALASLNKGGGAVVVPGQYLTISYVGGWAQEHDLVKAGAIEARSVLAEYGEDGVVQFELAQT